MSGYNTHLLSNTGRYGITNGVFNYFSKLKTYADVNVDPTHDDILSDLRLYNVESFDNRKLYSSDYP